MSSDLFESKEKSKNCFSDKYFPQTNVHCPFAVITALGWLEYASMSFAYFDFGIFVF